MSLARTKFACLSFEKLMGLIRGNMDPGSHVWAARQKNPSPAFSGGQTTREGRSTHCSEAAQPLWIEYWPEQRKTWLLSFLIVSKNNLKVANLDIGNTACFFKNPRQKNHRSRCHQWLFHPSPLVAKCGVRNLDERTTFWSGACFGGETSLHLEFERWLEVKK